MSPTSPDLLERPASDRTPEFVFDSPATPVQPFRPTRRFWMRLVGILIVVALIVTGVVIAAWVAGAASARQAVQVQWDTRPLSCIRPAATVRNVGDDTGAQYISLAHLNPDLQCQLHFQIVNTGSTTVRIDSIRLPNLGATDFLYAAGIDGQKPHYGQDSIDATVTYPTESRFTLEPGQSTTIESDLRVRGKACSAVGGYEWTGIGPILGLTADGLSGSVTTVRGPWGVTGSPSSTCN